MNVLIGQCLNRRIAEIEVIRSEVKAWESARNGMNAGVNWQFTAKMPGSDIDIQYPEHLADGNIKKRDWQIYAELPHSFRIRFFD